MLTQSELKVAKVVHREVHLHGNYLSGGKIPVASGYDAGGVFPASLVLAGILLVRVSTYTTSSSVQTPLVPCAAAPQLHVLVILRGGEPEPPHGASRGG